MSYAQGKVIRDPIHGLISVDEDRELILDLIATPEFQRLRRIRQLGLGSLTYHGAEHTRFAHSLGVFHSAHRILQVLARRYEQHAGLKSILSGESKRHVKVAALLHDIGHGPFSHVSERAFDAHKAHEDRTKSLLSERDSPLGQVLRKHFSDSEITRIRELLDTHEHPFLHDIISSQLDADRMDYLLRDSHSAGVRYGHYDPDWLFNSFCLGFEPDPRAEKRLQNCRLCLDRRRGEHAAAQLIIARMHMSRQVYYHRTTRNWEAHLLCLFFEARRLAASDALPPLTHPAVQRYFQKAGRVVNRDFLALDDSSMIAHFSYWSTCELPAHAALAEWSTAIIQRKKLLERVDLSRLPPDSLTVEKLKTELEQRLGPERKDWVMDFNQFIAYKSPSSDMLEVDPDSYWEDVSKSAILLAPGEISAETPRSTPIQADSALLQGICHSAIPIFFLFVRPAQREAVEKIIDFLVT